MVYCSHLDIMLTTCIQLRVASMDNSLPRRCYSKYIALIFDGIKEYAEFPSQGQLEHPHIQQLLPVLRVILSFGFSVFQFFLWVDASTDSS